MPSQCWDSTASDETACEPLTPRVRSLALSDFGSLASNIQVREDEAQTLLRTSTDPGNIRLLCLFPFKDPDTPFEILSRRADETLNACLYDRRHNTIEPPTSSWGYIPPVPSPTTNAAHQYEVHFETVFSKLTFESLIRGACGYSTASVKDVLDGVDHTRLELCRRFQELDQPKDKYEMVAEDLKNQNPLALWALSTSIWNTNDLPDPSDALSSIYHPIQDLFKRRDLSLIPMLQRLAILKTLHQKNILDGDDAHWECLQSADFSFLDQINSQEPRHLAESMTIKDHALFRKICVADADKLADMRSQSSKLVDNVKICLIALPNLVKPVSEVAKDLLNSRNFYSGMPLLRGLQEAGHCPQNLSEYWLLHDTLHTYAAYRAHYSKDPALPYLFPHIFMLGRAQGEKEKGNILSELFQFVAYPGWRENIQDIIDTDSKGATRAETNQQLRKSKLLPTWTKAISTLSIAFLVAIRQYGAKCLHPRRKPVQDIENGIQILHSTQIPHSKDIRFSVSSNTLCRVIESQRDVGVGNRFEFDIVQTLIEWKILQRNREQEQQKLPRVQRDVRVRRRVFCNLCQFNTGRYQGHYVRCGKIANVKGSCLMRPRQ